MLNFSMLNFLIGAGTFVVPVLCFCGIIAYASQMCWLEAGKRARNSFLSKLLSTLFHFSLLIGFWVKAIL